MVKIEKVFQDYLSLITKKKLTGLRQVKIKEFGTGVILFQALAKKNTPKNLRSLYGTSKAPRVHIGTLTSKGDVFLFKSLFKYIK